MYAHQVIKDLDKYLKRKSIYDDRFLENLENLRKGISVSHKFHLGNISSYKKVLKNMDQSLLFQGENGQFVKCPYDSMWIDFNVDVGSNQEEENEHASKKRGVIVKELLPDFIMCQPICYVNHDKLWYPSAIVHLILINDRFGKRSDVLDYFFSKEPQKRHDLVEVSKVSNVHHWYIPTSTNLEQAMHTSIEGKQSVQRLVEHDMHELAVLNAALKLLCCKNIVTENVYPSTKKKRKKGKLTHPKKKFVYKVLNVTLPTTRKKSTSESSTVGAGTRVHFCRGHFKTYTEDAPLFGRFVGRYWWQTQVRGNPEQGFSAKDYNLKTA
jgi:hypothetical protein